MKQCVKSRFLGDSVDKEGKSSVKLYTEVSSLYSNAAFTQNDFCLRVNPQNIYTD